MTKLTGVTMRNLRRLGHLGALPDPSWPAVEFARVIRLAGSWPRLARAP
ncbi:MAG: hypothetical protein ABSB96_09120 [Gaiellaceae bacterium]